MFTGHEQKTINKAISILENALANTNIAFTSSVAVHQYCRLNYAAQEHETFNALWLNSQHQLIKAETLFSGTIDGAAVYPREVIKTALKHNAAAVIFCHNHPSGHSEPSHADKSLTQQLNGALNVIEVRLLDHIIACGTESFSFAESGLL